MRALFKSITTIVTILLGTATLTAQEIRLQGKPRATVANPLPSFSTIDDDNSTNINNSPRTSNGTEFGNVNRGESVTHSFVIQNRDNNDTLTITGITVNSSQYSVSGLPSFPFTLQDQNGSNSDEEEFSITYTPGVFGTTTLRISLFSNDSNEGNTTFRVSGAGIGPDMEVFGSAALNDLIQDGAGNPAEGDAERRHFGNLDVNASGRSRTFRIRNIDGNRALNMSNPRFTGTGASSFSFSGVNAAINLNDGNSRDFTITFDPSSAGTKTATFRVDTNDERFGKGEYSFNVRGIGTSEPNIAVEGKGDGIAPTFSTILDGAILSSQTASGNGTNYENVDIGDDDTEDFRILNTGSGTLSGISASSSNGSEFRISGVASSVSPGNNANDEFTIRFVPNGRGTRSSIITIVSNDPDSEMEYTFRVQGVGTGGPEIRLEGFRPNNPFDPWATIDNGESPPKREATQFRNIDLGRGSIAKALRIRNRGTSDLRITSVKSSNEDVFKITNVMALPYTLGTTNNDDEDLFNIQFVPITFGRVVATITVESDDPDSPSFTFEVDGTGVGSDMQVFGRNQEILDGDTFPRPEDGTEFTEPLVAGGDETIHQFTIRNTRGNQALNLSNPRIFPADAPFELKGVLGVGGLADGNERDFDVIFKPEAAGTFNAEVRVDTDDRRAGRSVFSFAVRGTATGTPNIQVEGFGNSSFSEIENGATGSSDPRNGNGTRFQDTDLGESDVRTLRIINEGSETLTYSVSNSNESEFRISGLESSLLGGSDAKDPFNVTFAPDGVGLRSAIITINSNDPDSEREYMFRIQGEANGPQIVVTGGERFSETIRDGDSSPRAEDNTLFQAVPVNAGSNTRSFRITNTGNRRLNIRNEVNGTGFTGSGASSFRFERLATNGVFPEISPDGGFDEFDIVFDPTTTGLIEATFNIVNNTAGRTETYSFAVAGIGSDPATAPNIQVSGGQGFSVPIPSGSATPSSASPTDFGTIQPGGASISRTFRIENTDLQSDLTISGISVFQAGSAFGVVSFPSSVAAGSSAEFSVRLDKDAGAGIKAGIVRITSDDPDTPTYAFNIAGAIEAPEGMAEVTGVETNEDGDIVITVDAPPGTTFRITSSTDLNTWSPMAGQTGLTSGAITLSDVIGAGGSGLKRFYRVEME